MIYKTQAKYELFEHLSEWLRAMSPADRTFAIRDLCTRYSTDMGALSRNAWMNWDDLAKIARQISSLLELRQLNRQLAGNLIAANRNRDLLGAVIDNIDDGLAVKDQDGRYLLLNRAAAARSGRAGPARWLVPPGGAEGAGRSAWLWYSLRRQARRRCSLRCRGP